MKRIFKKSKYDHMAHIYLWERLKEDHRLYAVLMILLQNASTHEVLELFLNTESETVSFDGGFYRGGTLFEKESFFSQSPG